MRQVQHQSAPEQPRRSDRKTVQYRYKSNNRSRWCHPKCFYFLLFNSWEKFCLSLLNVYISVFYWIPKVAIIACNATHSRSGKDVWTTPLQ